jgi:hypothetical protein
MRWSTRCILVIAALLLVGCVTENPDLPRFNVAAASLSPLSPGTTRFFFYRLLDPNDPSLGTTVYLNDKDVGFSRTGTVFYRDVPPGPYSVTVLSRGQYPNQFKNVVAQASQNWYVRITTPAPSWSCDPPGCRGDAFVVQVVDPRTAEAEMAPLALAP